MKRRLSGNYVEKLAFIKINDFQIAKFCRRNEMTCLLFKNGFSLAIVLAL